MPKTVSPIFRIDRFDPAVTRRLNELLQQEQAIYNNGVAYRSAEVMLDRRDTYSPDLIKALLEQGEIAVWDYQRQLPSYPHIGTGFSVACGLLEATPGVELVITPVSE